MSDHIEAMATYLRRTRYALGPDAPAWLLEGMWAAGVEPLIAHEPCGGGGIKLAYEPATMLGPSATPCPGPHTVIVKGDGTKLYADPNTFGWFTHRYTPPGDGIPIPFFKVPLPSEWRIE